MSSNPEELVKYMNKNYPNGNYHSVYEAGFSGFWADRALREAGFDNMIVNPAQVPRNAQEKLRKSDAIDSSKLARELENGSLQDHKMYIPTVAEEGFRSLCRCRTQLVREQARIKNQIKALLNFLGVRTPNEKGMSQWSGKYIEYLSELKLPDKASEIALKLKIVHLRNIRLSLAETVKQIRLFVEQDSEKKAIIKLLMTVPGVGFTIATILYSELMNIERFSKFDNLCRYVGLSPDTRASGQSEVDLGLTKLYLRYVRNVIIESAWISMRKDPALTEAYCNFVKRMSKQEAIVRIAKKIVSRVMSIWKNKKEYVLAVVA